MTWIYFISIIIVFSSIALIVRWRSIQVVKERNLLRKLVDENTREVKKQAEILEIQARKLKELDISKSNFFANISHEFRTPLTLILGPLKTRYKENNISFDKDQLKMMIRNGEKLLKLVNQLLDLSRLEAGNMVLEVRKLDITHFFSVAAESFKNAAELNSIEFLIQFPEEKIEGYFDPAKIEQVIYNLLSNAIKFTPAGGEVSMKLARNAKSSRLNLTVSDTGIGIEKNQLEKIFDRFYQVDPTDTREHEGSGIGLALTKELIELHGGTIEVTSDIGSGSSFHVSIPIDEGDYDPAFIKNEEYSDDKDSIDIQASSLSVLEEFDREEKVNPEYVEFEHLKNAPLILIVEDNSDLRDFIRSNLNLDYIYKEASNGSEGLAIALETVPDLVITDLMMPKMNGIELCEKLKSDEKTSHIPVIMLTAKSDADSKLEGLETGADDYITKPFDISELQLRIKNLVEQREKLRQKYSKQIKLQPSNIEIKSKDEEFLNRAIKTIETYMSDTEFTVEVFQKEMWMSRMQLHRKLKALTEKSTSEFIRSIRMKRASQLLSSQMGSIAEVAYEVGFNDPSYFTKCFRQEFGISPSEYDKIKHLNENENDFQDNLQKDLENSPQKDTREEK